MTTSVEIAAYDPAWPGLFEIEAAAIRSALGLLALAVDHVGSTSVPGLAAKPVIDIDLIVPDSADEATYASRLEAAGYRFKLREPDWFEHRLFERRQPRVNLHVFSDGCEEPRRMARFRDWLRADAADRDLYARTKQTLAARDWPSVQDYADAKSAVVGQIMRRALGWEA